MADYENGLPPEGTDITDEKVNAVAVNKRSCGAESPQSVGSVAVSIRDYTIVGANAEDAGVKSVLLTRKELSGQNFTTFL